MKKLSLKRIICWLCFIIYLASLFYFVFFASFLDRNFDNSEYRYNIYLFREIKRFWEYRGEIGKIWILNIAGNVLAFMPFGFLLPIVSNRKVRIILTIILSFALSLLIELGQLVTRVGAFDVDDILLNTIGGFLGFLIYALIYKIITHKKSHVK